MPLFSQLTAPVKICFQFGLAFCLEIDVDTCFQCFLSLFRWTPASSSAIISSTLLFSSGVHKADAIVSLTLKRTWSIIFLQNLQIWFLGGVPVSLFVRTMSQHNFFSNKRTFFNSTEESQDQRIAVLNFINTPPLINLYRTASS